MYIIEKDRIDTMSDRATRSMTYKIIWSINILVSFRRTTHDARSERAFKTQSQPCYLSAFSSLLKKQIGIHYEPVSNCISCWLENLILGFVGRSLGLLYPHFRLLAFCRVLKTQLVVLLKVQRLVGTVRPQDKISFENRLLVFCRIFKTQIMALLKAQGLGNGQAPRQNFCWKVVYWYFVGYSKRKWWFF